MTPTMAAITKHNTKNSATCWEPPGSPGVSGSLPELGLGTMLPSSPPLGSVEVVSGVTWGTGGSGSCCADTGGDPMPTTAATSTTDASSVTTEVPVVRDSAIGWFGADGSLVVELGVEHGRQSAVVGEQARGG